MKEEKLQAILRLQKTPYVGDIVAKKLIHAVGDVEAIFMESSASLTKIHGIGQRIAQALQDTSIWHRVEKEMHYLQKQQLSYAYFLDDDYPVYLKHSIDGPILFFYSGCAQLTKKRMISIVGTRNMTRYGRDLCETLVKDLQAYQPTIVSGFAYGVDIEAHKQALQCGMETIAVMAHGFEHIYPKAHQKYKQQVLENGAFVSEFWHDEFPLRENFLKRNRIVAGLSEATVVIESAEKGGSLVTADIAHSYDREVFAFPGRATDNFSSGCNALVKQHKAHMIESAQDLVAWLNWKTQPPAIAKQETRSVTLTEPELKVIAYLRDGSEQGLDVIALETKIPLQELTATLLQLELKGLVKPLPGKQFSIS